MNRHGGNTAVPGFVGSGGTKQSLSRPHRTQNKNTLTENVRFPFQLTHYTHTQGQPTAPFGRRSLTFTTLCLLEPEGCYCKRWLLFPGAGRAEAGKAENPASGPVSRHSCTQCLLSPVAGWPPCSCFKAHRHALPSGRCWTLVTAFGAFLLDTMFLGVGSSSTPP